MESEIYTIKTAGFEGPLGVLFGLIEERKLHINDLSLAEVTEDYLKYVSELKEKNPAQISSFVVVVATLILIKSKSLLPDLSLTSEEEGDIKDLEKRLRLYELFTKLSLHVRKNFGKKIIFPGEERRNEILVFLPDDQITPQNMMTFASDVLGRMPKKMPLPEVEVRKVISIKEMIDRFTERIKETLKISFRDWTHQRTGKAATKEEKIEVIVGFLAMLELVRQGILDATQSGDEEDIIISKQVLSASD